MNLIDLLKRHEGFRSKVYKCSAGKLTAGYGRNLEDLGLSEEEATMLLLNDIRRVQAEAQNNFKWFYELDQARQDVVLSLIFNMGLHGFLQTK